MTPLELRDEVASYSARQRDELAARVSSAWYVAMFGINAYVGQLPDLATLIGRLKTPQPERLSPAAQHTQVALLSEYTGIPMQPLSEAAKQALLRMRES